MSYRLTPFLNVGYRSFARDDVGRIAWFQKGSDASYNPMENGQGDCFGYDGEGQLAAVQYEGHMTEAGFAGAQRSQGFTYDQMGTRAHTTDAPAGTGGRDWAVRPNGLNQSWVAQNWAWFYYDNNFADPSNATPRGNGCVAAFNGVNFAYNALNQMTAANNYGSTPCTFAYDPLGRLVKRTVNGQGTFFYWDGWSLVQEGPSAAAAGKIYVHGARVDELLARYDYTLSAWHFLHYDARGHGTHLSDREGNLVEQYAYDAFGRPWFYSAAGGSIPGSTVDNRFLFTGREWLKELQIYDYRHRHYHPEAGRFLQPDPRQFEAGDYNLYRYCHNDPVNKVDPTGLTDQEYFRDGDPSRARSSLIPAKPQSFTIAGHGYQHADRLGQVIDPRYATNPNGVGPTISTQKIASDAMANSRFKETTQIFLLVCSAGADASKVASDLAKLTDRTVIAFDKQLWINEKGNYFAADPMKIGDKFYPNMDRLGNMVIFDAKGKLVKRVPYLKPR